MNHYSRYFRSKGHLVQQLQCLGAYFMVVASILWLLSNLSTVNHRLFQVALMLMGWLTWTFIEYIAHRFWMHGPGSGELFNHVHHHSHPTEINVTTMQRVLLTASCFAMQYTAYRLQNYFTLWSGFYAGFVGYFFVHAFLHKKWFGKICPRLQRFHILHHCRLPHHCFGVTVHWWDYVFNTTPPKKVSPTPRIVRFYFNGRTQALATVFIACLLSSCSHYYYGPNTANIPLLKEKNEGKVNFNFYTTPESSGIEFQGAFAVGKNTAIMANFVKAFEGFDIFQWGNDGNSVTDKGSYGEIGIGYFKRLQPAKWVFETYSGIGFGGVRNTYENFERSKVNGIKFFIQPSLGWTSRNFEIGFSVRMAYVNLAVRRSSVTELHNAQDFQDIEYIRNNRSGFLLEPGFLIRAGGGGALFMLNYTSSSNLNRNWKQEDRSISIGICIPFKIVPGHE